MREGHITGILDEDEMTEKEIMLYATGLKGVA
jgi:hypothetical protein